MVKTPSFKRLILRAVLRQVSPMVIRLVSVSDQMPLHEFHSVFRTILGWNGDLGYVVRVHGQEINSFRRKRERQKVGGPVLATIGRGRVEQLAGSIA